MWRGVKVKTPGSAAVLTTAELKSRLRIGHSEDDTLLGEYLAGAVARIDGPAGVGYALLPQTWTRTLDAFPGRDILLPGAPVTGISSVSYIDPDGASQTVDSADYRLETGVEPARLCPAFGKSWPSTRAVNGAVTIDYTLGHADAASVPADLKDAVALIVAHRYEHREPVNVGNIVTPIPMAVDAILDEYRRGLAAG